MKKIVATWIASAVVLISTYVGIYLALTFVTLLAQAPKVVVLISLSVVTSVCVAIPTLLATVLLRLHHRSFLWNHFWQSSLLYVTCLIGALVMVEQYLDLRVLPAVHLGFLFWVGIAAAMGVMGNLFGLALVSVWNEARASK